MSDFAAGAARLAGLVPRLLAWRPAEFWQATPAELSAIVHAAETSTAEATLDRAELNHLMERDRDG